ncbi:MAG TPA: hypothetical protein ENK55_05685 [Actinobacteria bacterium]|nr:hypothetical protein [Actinomycetota bacterium]
MRVVGYIREPSVPADTETAFVQSERIRRWTAEYGHQLIAVCRDVAAADGEASRDGYRALLGILGTGDVDAVVVASLEALSPDKVLQEIMIKDLRSRGVTVVSTDPEDVAELADTEAAPLRVLVRDVLARLDRYREEMAVVEAPTPVPARDLVVELLPAEEPPVWGPHESATHTARPSA